MPTASLFCQYLLRWDQNRIALSYCFKYSAKEVSSLIYITAFIICHIWWIIKFWVSIFWKCTLSALDDTNNDAKQTQGTAENLDNQNFHERVWILSISNCTSWSRNSYTNAAEKVAESNWNSCPEERIACKVARLQIALASCVIDLSLQNDGHNDSIDGDCLTENNAIFVYYYLTKFLERILGAFTAAPKILAPAM